MQKYRHIFRSFIKFLPFLLFYIIIIVFISHKIPGHDLDERRYLLFASNITQGFYSPQDHFNLWNGPGWPLILVPFTYLKNPLLPARLLNAFFLFFAQVYFFNIAKSYTSARKAYIYTMLLGLYPPILRNIAWASTETFSIFLICAFLYHSCRVHNKPKTKIHLLTAFVYLAYLALTKILYGYVISVCLLCYLALSIIFKNPIYRKNVAIFSLALLMCSPYLLYTYSLTGRIFYWGNSGGLSFYWMSSPYAEDLGDWHNPKNVYGKNILAKHRQTFDNVRELSSVEADEYLKKKALQNIKKYPKKFLKNWFANIGRLLFSYPYSYTRQKLTTYFYIIPNMYFLAFVTVGMFAFLKNIRFIPAELITLMIFFLIAFGGTSLLSAYNRMFTVIAAILYFIALCSFERYIVFKIDRNI